MRTSDGRVVIGVILIAVGILLALDNLVHFHFHFLDYIFNYPALMIVIGIVILFNSRNNFFGYILLFGGAFLFAKYELYLEIDYIFEDFWPIIIIAFGLYLLLKRKSGRSQSAKVGDIGAGSEKDEFEYNKMDYIDVATILGDSDKAFNSQQFKGGKITTIFAGSKIDLRNCKLGGERQIIDLFTIFGGTTIFLPSDWKVVISVVSIFGGFEDDRILPSADQVDEEKILVIKGTVIFGGGEIKN